MSTADENVARLKKCYQAWHDTKGGSVEDWFECMDDDIDFGSLAAAAPGLEWTAPVKGKDKVRGYMSGLLADWAMDHYTIDEYVAQGDTVVVIGSTGWTNRKTGKKLDTPKVDVWRFTGGKAVSFFEYYDTANVIAAAS